MLRTLQNTTWKQHQQNSSCTTTYLKTKTIIQEVNIRSIAGEVRINS